jgi:hypothetical protein
MAPNQIVPILADQGTFVASESSFYRVLRQEEQLAHRGKAKAPQHKRPERWSGTTRNWEPEHVVYLNPMKSDQKIRKAG